jgi:hypothetical protein
MESCYHPVLEIQLSCENPPTDFLKAFVFANPLEEIYSENRISFFSNYLLYLFTISLVLFDKVGSLFFFPQQSPRLTIASIPAPKLQQL